MAVFDLFDGVDVEACMAATSMGDILKDRFGFRWFEVGEMAV